MRRVRSPSNAAKGRRCPVGCDSDRQLSSSQMRTSLGRIAAFAGMSLLLVGATPRGPNPVPTAREVEGCASSRGGAQSPCEEHPLWYCIWNSGSGVIMTENFCDRRDVGC